MAKILSKAVEEFKGAFTMRDLAIKLQVPISEARALVRANHFIKETGQFVRGRKTYRAIDCQMVEMIAGRLGGRVSGDGVLFTLEQAQILAVRLQVWP